MSQMNPKEVSHNTAYSVQLPYIAGHSLQVLMLKSSKNMKPRNCPVYTDPIHLKVYLKPNGKTLYCVWMCLNLSVTDKWQLHYFYPKRIEYIQGVSKNCAVGVSVTEETIFVQFLRSRSHSKALYFSYFMMWNFSF